ncbi:hypothetical protein ACFWH6_36070, partial [Streptomyces griseorubiginosus]
MNHTEDLAPARTIEDRPLTLVDEHAHAWSPVQARTRFRAGLAGPTAGVAAGHTQVNLISVPADWAYDMLLFCQRNPKPCPVLDVTDAGAWTTVLADGADLRTDLPRYRVWQDGELVDEPTDVGGGVGGWGAPAGYSRRDAAPPTPPPRAARSEPH